MNRKDSRIVNFLESPIVYTIVIVTSFQPPLHGWNLNEEEGVQWYASSRKDLDSLLDNNNTQGIDLIIIFSGLQFYFDCIICSHCGTVGKVCEN